MAGLSETSTNILNHIVCVETIMTTLFNFNIQMYFRTAILKEHPLPVTFSYSASQTIKLFLAIIIIYSLKLEER